MGAPRRSQRVLVVLALALVIAAAASLALPVPTVARADDLPAVEATTDTSAATTDTSAEMTDTSAEVTTPDPVESLPAPASPAEEPPAPGDVAVAVDGRPIGTGGARIASCSVSIDVSGLDPDPSHEVAFLIEATSPTVPEESDAVLVDETATVDTPSVSRAYDMTALIAPFERKPNGYHIRVSVAVDGTTVGSHIYWLGCDEDQTGHPTRLQFEAEWHRVDDTVLAPPFDEVLPDGWRETFDIEAESRIGSATCSYPEGSDVLECTYDNPGHGSEKPGLVIPGNPEETYTVAVEGLPAHWIVDPATVGTFVGRETCPRGEDHESHEEATGDRAHETEEPCIHTVVLREQAVPPSSTTSTTAAPTSSSTSTSPSSTSTSAPAAVAATSTGPSSAAAAPTTVVAGSSTLPATGTDVGRLVAAALLLMSLGALALMGSSASRRRRVTLD